MNPVRLFFLSALTLLCLSAGDHAFAQENQDNQPHIIPRTEEKEQRPARPAPTPTPAAQPAAEQQPQAVQQPADQDTESQGESSSKDSQIDLNAGPRHTAPPRVDSEDLPYDPHRAEKDIEVGNYYLKLKNYRAALERFNDALLYKPNDADATYGLAVTQERMDLFTQAYKSYSRYLEVLPKGPMAKDAQEALSRLEPRIDHGDDAGSTQKKVGEDLQEGEKNLANNEYDAARQRFEEAMRLAPDNPVVYFRLAQSLQGLQRLDPAQMYYRKYLELQPNGEFAAVARKNINRIKSMLGQ